MKNGKRLAASESLSAMRERAASQLARLPPALRGADAADEPYRVEISAALGKL